MIPDALGWRVGSAAAGFSAVLLISFGLSFLLGRLLGLFLFLFSGVPRLCHVIVSSVLSGPGPTPNRPWADCRRTAGLKKKR